MANLGVLAEERKQTKKQIATFSAKRCQTSGGEEVGGGWGGGGGGGGLWGGCAGMGGWVGGVIEERIPNT